MKLAMILKWQDEHQRPALRKKLQETLLEKEQPCWSCRGENKLKGLFREERETKDKKRDNKDEKSATKDAEGKVTVLGLVPKASDNLDLLAKASDYLDLLAKASDNLDLLADVLPVEELEELLAGTDKEDVKKKIVEAVQRVVTQSTTADAAAEKADDGLSGFYARDYLRWRINPAIQRLSRLSMLLYRQSSAFQVIIFVITAINGILALLGEHMWQPGFVALATGCQSIGDHLKLTVRQANIKAARMQLEVLKTEWNSFSLVERGFIDHKSYLVTSAEDLIMSADTADLPEGLLDSKKKKKPADKAAEEAQAAEGGKPAPSLAELQ